MNPYEQLSEDERIRLIGDLLAIAVARFWSEQPPASRRGASPVPAAVKVTPVWELVEDEIEKAVLRYLDAHVSAAPAQLKRALNIPHMTLARRLERLRRLGFVVVSGRTKGAGYSLARSREIRS